MINSDIKKGNDKMEHEYEQEYRHASCRNADHLFSDILSQHALVMVDAAVPDLPKPHYIRLGGRLSNVQASWVNLLCVGLENTVQTERDKQYRRIVTNVIKTFTNKLLDMLVEDVHVPHHELIGDADTFHCMVSGNAEHSLRETKRLFLLYVNALSKLYQSKTVSKHKRAAIDCFHVAFALGSWLDATIFST